MNNYWSKKEIGILKKNWKLKTDREISKLLLKRTICSIEHKRSKLGLRRIRPRNQLKKNPTCMECGVKLTEENWHICYRKSGHYICKECDRKRQRKYYAENKEKCRKFQRDYARQHYLEVKGKRIRVNKRPHQDRCELCGEEKSRIEYHHWDDETPENGLWLCFDCHRLAEVIDKFGLNIGSKYLKLKGKIENKAK